jgi:hypothetical protein
MGLVWPQLRLRGRDLGGSDPHKVPLVSAVCQGFRPSWPRPEDRQKRASRATSRMSRASSARLPDQTRPDCCGSELALCGGLTQHGCGVTRAEIVSTAVANSHNAERECLSRRRAPREHQASRPRLPVALSQFYSSHGRDASPRWTAWKDRRRGVAHEPPRVLDRSSVARPTRARRRSPGSAHRGRLVISEARNYCSARHAMAQTACQMKILLGNTMVAVRCRGVGQDTWFSGPAREILMHLAHVRAIKGPYDTRVFSFPQSPAALVST